MARSCYKPPRPPAADRDGPCVAAAPTTLPAAPTSCDSVIRGYYNTAQTYVATCPAGSSGADVSVTIAARRFRSTISQEVADTAALALARSQAESQLVCVVGSFLIDDDLNVLLDDSNQLLEAV